MVGFYDGNNRFDFASLVESFPDGLLVTDADGTIVLVNQGLETMFDYPRSELIGKPVESLVPDHLRGPHAAHRIRFRAEPVARPMGSGLELRARRRDGSDFPVEISLSPINSDGSRYFFAAVRDVSERVADQAENQAIRHVIDSAHDALYMFTTDSLRLVYANRGLTSQLGYELDELLTMTPLHFMPDVSRAALVARIQPLISGETESLSLSTTHRRRNGSDVPVDVIINCPRPARSDQPRRFVALARDVSRRFHLEQERDDGMRWLDALAQVRSTLLSEPTLNGALTLIADEVRLLTDADVVVVAEPNVEPEVGSPPAVSTELTCHYSSASPDYTGLVDSAARTLTVDRTIGDVMRGATVAANRAASSGRSDLWLQPLIDPFEQVLVVPIERRGTVHGLLLALKATTVPFTDGQIAMVASMAAEASKAYSLVDARRAKVHLRLLEDRERLGRDLHDLIIQRIFAAGLRLQSAQALVDDPVVSGRIAETVSQLDETITELRHTIFQLSTPVDLVVADRLQTLVDEAAHHLPTRPELIITGDPSRIPESVLLELEPALTEMLANVWRHAAATKIEVTVQVGPTDVLVSVSDDGRGFDPDLTAGGNGLRNLGIRAERLDGSCRVDSTLDRGTTVHWTVALEPVPSQPETAQPTVGEAD